MKIGFYGAAGEVTGSNFLLELSAGLMLVDCGLFQGKRLAEAQNNEPFPYEPRAIKAAVLTHAHLDHCGRLPKLYKEGFRGKIYATAATRDLAELIMHDAASLMLREAEEEGGESLYLPVDVDNTMRLFETLDYREKKTILPGAMVELFDAGHILGSSTVLIEADGKKVVFSGDIGNHPAPILREPEVPSEADTVIMETTYGGRTHESSQDRRVKLRSVIRETITKHGILLIPAFALERTQELLYELGALIQEESIPAVPVFLDSPLAISATRVYYSYPEYFDADAQIILRQGGQLFSFPTLRITESVEQSKAIREINGSKIVVAGSGMMEGGRILYHARDFLGESATTLLIIGYQAVGTLGRRLYDGERRVKILGHFVNVKAHVVAIGAYSAHADEVGLEDWLHSFAKPPQQVFLVHSEGEGALAFAKRVGKGYPITIPELNQVVEV